MAQNLKLFPYRKRLIMIHVVPGRLTLSFITITILFYSCKTSGPGIFGKKSPHQQYSDRLTDAGLRSSALGNSWFTAAEKGLTTPLSISLPYKETGYFSAERPGAAGLRFNVLLGQKLTVTVERKPTSNFTLYIDLWKAGDGNKAPKYLAAADTSTYTIQHEVEENSNYILRLQPELLSSGEYTITISAGPSLAYPIKAPGKDHIKSFWGAERDGGSRRHEGIDMFATFGTPVVAAANGRIIRVNENTLGGKVVWLRPADKDYTLYYAHLDSQMVTDGETVLIGDTIGLMGNTGNARSTSPHLHFGIYSNAGPVDPLPFVKPIENEPENITASVKLNGKLVRNGSAGAVMYGQPSPGQGLGVPIAPNTVVRIEAATSSWFKVTLPNGQEGFIKNNFLKGIEKSLRSLSLKNSVPLLDKPDSLAAKKTSIPAGETVDILGSFNDYYFVSTRDNINGWITK